MIYDDDRVLIPYCVGCSTNERTDRFNQMVLLNFSFSHAQAAQCDMR